MIRIDDFSWFATRRILARLEELSGLSGVLVAGKFKTAPVYLDQKPGWSVISIRIDGKFVGSVLPGRNSWLKWLPARPGQHLIELSRDTANGGGHRGRRWSLLLFGERNDTSRETVFFRHSVKLTEGEVWLVSFTPPSPGALPTWLGHPEKCAVMRLTLPEA